MPKPLASDPFRSLHDTLLKLGFTHKQTGTGTGYQHDIFFKDDKRVFTGSANETWEWLRAEGHIQ